MEFSPMLLVHMFLFTDVFVSNAKKIIVATIVTNSSWNLDKHELLQQIR